MRSDAQDRIIDYLHQDEVVDPELTHVAALSIESAPLPPLVDDSARAGAALSPNRHAGRSGASKPYLRSFRLGCSCPLLAALVKEAVWHPRLTLRSPQHDA